MLAGGAKETVACVFPAVAVPIVGAPGTLAAMVIEKPWVALPKALFAVTTPENVPVALGVPLTTPVVPLRARPVGSTPLVTLKVGAGEPEAVYVCEYDTPNVPLGGAALVIAGAIPGVTETVPEAGPVPIAFVAVTEHV